MAQPVILEDGEQLRNLARVIYFQEANAIQSILFASENERVDYLIACRTSYDTIVSLLDRCLQQKDELQHNSTLSSPASQIYSYMVACSNSALQMIRNARLRETYVFKIRDHANSLLEELEELKGNPNAENTIDDAARLAENASEYRNAIMEYIRKNQSTVSRNFSRSIKESGMTFEDLVQRYQAKLGLEGRFSDLEEADKLRVYEAIIEASGRGNPAVNQAAKLLLGSGMAVFVFIAGMMVWDIFSSEHVFQTETRDAMVGLASAGGAFVEDAVAVAMETVLESTAEVVMVASWLTGIVGAFMFGAFVGWMVDLIFSTGRAPPSSTDGLVCYVAPMPDGVALARQIAHLNNNNNNLAA